MKRGATVRDLIKSEGMGGVVGWRGASPWRSILTHRDQMPERDLDEEGDGMCLGLAHPSAAPHPHMGGYHQAFVVCHMRRELRYLPGRGDTMITRREPSIIRSILCPNTKVVLFTAEVP